MNIKQRFWTGILFWSVSILTLAMWFTASDVENTATASPAKVLIDSFTSISQVRWVDDPTGRVRQGDVVFAHDSARWREVGYVSQIQTGDPRSPNRLRITVFDPGSIAADSRWTLHHCSGRLDEVFATLLPEDRREALHQQLTEAMDTHASEITAAVLPLVLQSMQASLPVIEQELRAAIGRHQGEIESLAARYRDEVVQDRLIPLVRTEVIPIIRRHGQGPAEEIGREIWGKASLWRFGWRAIYDKSPLPERELVQEEWHRFLDDEVIPIVEDDVDEIAAAVEGMFRDLAANEMLRDELLDVIAKVSQDKPTRDLIRVLVTEAVIDNQRLRQVWSEIWTSPEARRRLQIAGQRIEPILRRIGDEVMGTREGGIRPGFARVLRNQILGKDRSWITIQPGDGLSLKGIPDDRPQIVPADRFMPYPVIHLATDPSSREPRP